MKRAGEDNSGSARSSGANAAAGVRVYADHAATSFPKAPGVAEAIASVAQRLFSPGRGGYREALEAGAVVASCRRRLAVLLGAAGEEEIVLTAGATDGLNLVIKGVARRAMKRRGRAHIVAATIDHNSVLRPLMSLATEGVEHTLVSPEGWYLDPARVAACIREDTCLVVVNHASNVTGAVQPVAEIVAACRAVGGQGVAVLLDAAQSAGHMVLRADQLDADFIAMPGHKGLLGPQGIGALHVRSGREDLIDPWREGGTGSRSEAFEHPREMPVRFEAGTMNVLGAAGLDAGVKYIQGLPDGVASVHEHEQRLIDRVLSSGALDGYELWGPATGRLRTAAFTLRHGSVSPVELTAILESSFGVLCRAGLACAPRAWGEGSGAREAGGVRLSFGATSTVEDVDAVCAALRAIASGLG